MYFFQFHQHFFIYLLCIYLFCTPFSFGIDGSAAAGPKLEVGVSNHGGVCNLVGCATWWGVHTGGVVEASRALLELMGAGAILARALLAHMGAADILARAL